MVVVGFPAAYLVLFVFVRLLIHIDWREHEVPKYYNRMIWVHAALVLCAYIFAVIGVSLDRRGDRFPFSSLVRRLLRILPARSASHRPFASSDAAQRWLEIRRNAWLLPAVVFLFFMVLLWSTLLPFSIEDVARSLTAFLCVPPIAAFFIGFSMGKSNFWARELHLAPLPALRPLSCTALAQAKLHAAWVSVRWTWAAVIVLIPMWVSLSGYGEEVLTNLDWWFHDLSAWRICLAAPAGLVGLLGLTWLQCLAGMCLSLTGRSAVVNGVVLLYGGVIATIAGALICIDSYPDTANLVQVLLWGLAGAIALVKVAALLWVWNRFGSASDRTIPEMALFWLVTAGCLVVAIEAAWPTGPISTHLLALFVVLTLPLARSISLPAALAWNRHK
jgi:hypothetical protein